MIIYSKWKKHLILSRSPTIRRHLPETYLFTRTSLKTLVGKFPLVYMKPVKGTGGGGILRIERVHHSFRVRSAIKSLLCTNLNQLYNNISRMIRGRQYLIQQGIHLLSIHHRPIDYRILLLRPESNWKYMGIMGKWAAKHKIVTNFCKGGKPMRFVNSLKLSKGLSNQQCSNLARRVHLLGLHVGKVMGTPYSLREMGIDLGIDHNQNIWLLEVNTRPQFKLFRYHSDKTLYNRIAKNVHRIRSRRR